MITLETLRRWRLALEDAQRVDDMDGSIADSDEVAAVAEEIARAEADMLRDEAHGRRRDVNAT